MNGADIFLPYYCPRLHDGNFLRSPCAGKVAEAKALRAKFPQALLGALEHCLSCQGKDIVVREAPQEEYTGDIRPEVTREIATINRIAQEDQGMGGAVKFKDHEEAERVLGPGKVPKEAPGPPECPKHPGEPQIACNPEGERAGQYLGKCRICQAELVKKMNVAKANKKIAREKMTPAVARDLGLKAAVQDAAVVSPPPDAAARSLKAGEAAFLLSKPASPANHASDQSAPPRCITHNLPIKFNAKGISMGGCEECRREIAAMGGHKARIKLAENPLERVFAGYLDELEWLRSYAKKQVRSPESQLIFMVKQAMAQGE